jgi:acetyl-CoA acetyltransferase
MAAAPTPAVKMALANTGLTIVDFSVIKLHNPFLANDSHIAKELEIDAECPAK